MVQEPLCLFSKCDADIVFNELLCVVDSACIDNPVALRRRSPLVKYPMLSINRTYSFTCVNPVLTGWIFPEPNDVPLTADFYLSHLTASSHTRPFPLVGVAGGSLPLGQTSSNARVSASTRPSVLMCIRLCLWQRKSCFPENTLQPA